MQLAVSLQKIFHLEKSGGVPAKRIMSIEEYKKKLIGNKDKFELNAFKKDKRSELIRVLSEN